VLLVPLVSDGARKEEAALARGKTLARGSHRSATAAGAQARAGGKERKEMGRAERNHGLKGKFTWPEAIVRFKICLEGF